jgi:ABC-type nitrate/sulfonate/bicarbonate transport system ATPase subunit
MINLKNISHKFNKSNKIFDNFNLQIEKNRFVSIVGPSGCGKSTLVNIIAGYLQANNGDVFINNKKTNNPNKDRIVINQENDLFEWMTVWQNMSLVSQDETNINKFLQMTELSESHNLYPFELSGGMKKRLSLARILAVNSDIIIMDEPFISLDYQVMEKLHLDLLSIVNNINKTTLLITHDIDEAIFLSDQIIVLTDSKPTFVKKIIDIKLDNRNLDIKYTPEFLAIKKEVKYWFTK